VRYASTSSIIATLFEEGENTDVDVVYLAEPTGWAALAEEDMLAVLPDEYLNAVDERFRSPQGTWVGTSGRSKVIVYNREAINPQTDLPASIMDFTDPKWDGRIGWAPTHGEWQIVVTAIRKLKGDAAAREWLQGIMANHPETYPNLISIVQAVARGEVDVGFVNHYYVPRLIAEEGEGFGARNHYIGHGDPGAVIDVAGIGIVKGTAEGDAAEEFVRYMLSESAQTYFSEQTREYPLSAGVQPSGDLPPLDSLDPPAVDLSDIGDLRGTLDLLREVGALP
jgi:iron(III) transport system substrate-binding protein